MPTKDEIKRAYLRALATLGDEVRAYNEVLERFAGPYDPAAPSERRKFVAEMLREVMDEVVEERRRAAGIPPLHQLVRKHWDIPGIIDDLRRESWYQTEPHRIDRQTFLASYKTFEELAKESVTEEEWAEAEEGGFTNEIVEDYMNALAEVLSDVMGEHVYVIPEAGDVIVGQYKEGDISEPPLSTEPNRGRGRYVITIYKGGRARHYYFPTLEAAKQVARDIFRRTGIIVGIEEAPRKR